MVDTEKHKFIYAAPDTCKCGDRRYSMSHTDSWPGESQALEEMAEDEQFRAQAGLAIEEEELEDDLMDDEGFDEEDGDDERD